MLDLWGNDLYLKHVYRTMRRHTYPTHITVLGDMLGSQWIDDAEFWTRVGRFWRIFAGAEKVREGGVAEGREWRDRLVMMPGNHDVGYAGDISRKRLQRYEDAFGAFNYQLSFRGNGSGEAGEAEIPALRIAVLNSLTLDKPVWDEELARDSWEFVETLGEEKRQTLLLTHVPLWKPAGVCVDAPEVTYFLPENGGGIRSQNLLSKETSVELLEKVFGGHNGVVLTGHDHEGCGSFHSWDGEGEEWGVRRGDGEGGDGVREVTVRSMMGEYGGNVGLLSAWWDKDLKGEYLLFQAVDGVLTARQSGSLDTQTAHWGSSISGGLCTWST